MGSGGRREPASGLEWGARSAVLLGGQARWAQRMGFSYRETWRPGQERLGAKAKEEACPGRVQERMGQMTG